MIDVLELRLLPRRPSSFNASPISGIKAPPEAAEIGQVPRYPYWRDAKRRDAEQLYA